jgi:hypothetical protein
MVDTQAEMPRSPWWRTALWAIGPVVLGIGVLVFLISHYSGGSSSNEPLPAAPTQPTGTPVQASLDKEARQVAGKWILTAVARKNTGASWELLDPTYPGKNDYTKASWAKGDIPVIPASFPVTNLEIARFNVTQSFPDQITVEVALIPKRGKPEIFELGLRRRGEGDARRWLVDYWMTRYRPGVRAEPE